MSEEPAPMKKRRQAKPLPKKERIEAIKDAIDNGARQADEIAAEIGLSKKTVYQYAKEEKLPLAPRVITSQERVEQIRAYASAGTPLEEIASKLELSPETVKSYAHDADIILPGTNNITSEEYTAAIKEAAEQGLSLAQISQKTGFSETTIECYLGKAQIKLSHQPNETKRDIAINSIRSSIESGVKTLDAICEQIELMKTAAVCYIYGAQLDVILDKKYQTTRIVNILKELQNASEKKTTLARISKKFKITGSTLRRYASMAGIRLTERAQGMQRRPDIDELVKKGFTLERIADEVLLSTERIRQYIAASGQYTAWKEKREEVKGSYASERNEQKQALQELTQTLWALMQKRAATMDFAEQKTIQFILQRKLPGRYTPEQLMAFFGEYKKAMDSGNPATLQYLAKHIGSPHASCARNVLCAVGLSAMHWTTNRCLLTSDQKDAIERSHDTSLPASDAAYFIGCADLVVQIRYRELGERKNTERSRTKIDGRILTYRLASQLYEALDAGFTQDETAELLDVSAQMVQRTIDMRQQIEPQIVNALNAIYPNRKSNTPYI